MNASGPLGRATSGLMAGLAGAAALDAATYADIVIRVRHPSSLPARSAARLAAASMAAQGLTDPREWSLGEWLSHLIPHLAYGMATTAALGRRPDTATGLCRNPGPML